MLLLALGCLGALLSPWTANAQTRQQLVNYGDSWKYFQGAAIPAANWASPAFSDAAWASGNGVLGFPLDENILGVGTIQTALTLGSPQYTTYYFRKQFFFSGATNGVSLVLSNVVDDGAVFYLNGLEIGRVGMAAGSVTYTNLASRGDDISAHGVDIFTVNPSSLIANGNNLLAVEVHQTSATSSDIVLGTSVTAVRDAPFSITTQPQSVNALVGDDISFSVAISGGPVKYQWQKDQLNINNATNSTFRINPVNIGSAGTYRVIVSNSTGSQTSSNAVLTVSADTQGPTMLSATVVDLPNTATNLIDIVWDEAILTTSISSNNFKVIKSGTSGPSAVSVAVNQTLLNGRTTRIRVAADANWKFFDNYYILVNGVADSKGNFCAPNAVIPVTWRIRTNAIQMSAAWDYYSLGAFDANVDSVYANFYKTNYTIDPTYWGRDIGIFWFDQGATTNTCAGDSLAPSQLGFFDYEKPVLFRTTFNLGTNFGNTGPITAELGLRYFVDDGFAVFLNGVQVYSNNIPNVTIDKSTRAIAAINPTCITNFSITVNNLLPRTNYLAVAVVNQQGIDSDMYFGLELDGIFPKVGTVPSNGSTNNLKLTISKPSADQLQLTWPNTSPNIYYGFVLEEATALGNPGNTTKWAPVSLQSNGMVFPAQPNQNHFYRLRKGANSGL